MKIVEAKWEERNFGKNVYEISLDAKDLQDLERVSSEINSTRYSGSYVTIKMPVGNLNALHRLQDEGFYFMETQLSLSKNLEEYETPEEVKLLSCDYEVSGLPKEKALWYRLIDNISPGMFRTDRIYLDPMLDNSVSCVRYQNWSKDLFEQDDAFMWVLREKKSSEITMFGIYTVNESRMSVHGVLGGVFDEYAGQGMLMIDSGNLFFKSKGLKILKTSISSNNLSMLRLYSYLHYKIYKETYVLRKIY